MDIHKVFEDPQVVALEEKIVALTEGRIRSDEDVLDLLEQRKNLLDSMNQYDDEMKNLLIEFNEALKKAWIKLFNKTKAVFEEYSRKNDCWEEFNVEGRLYLSYNYSKIHPIQTERAKNIWEMLTGGCYDKPYTSMGCEEVHWHKGDSANEDALKYIGMEDGTENYWEFCNNEVDEWAKDLHLVYPFYWVYKCVKIFSLYDLIYVRDFRFEIEIYCWDEFQQPSQ